MPVGLGAELRLAPLDEIVPEGGALQLLPELLGLGQVVLHFFHNTNISQLNMIIPVPMIFIIRCIKISEQILLHFGNNLSLLVL